MEKREKSYVSMYINTHIWTQFLAQENSYKQLSSSKINILYESVAFLLLHITCELI